MVRRQVDDLGQHGQAIRNAVLHDGRAHCVCRQRPRQIGTLDGADQFSLATWFVVRSMIWDSMDRRLGTPYYTTAERIAFADSDPVRSERLTAPISSLLRHGSSSGR